MILQSPRDGNSFTGGQSTTYERFDDQLSGIGLEAVRIAELVKRRHLSPFVANLMLIQAAGKTRQALSQGVNRG